MEKKRCYSPATPNDNASGAYAIAPPMLHSDNNSKALFYLPELNQITNRAYRRIIIMYQETANGSLDTCVIVVASGPLSLVPASYHILLLINTFEPCSTMYR